MFKPLTTTTSVIHPAHLTTVKNNVKLNLKALRPQPLSALIVNQPNSLWECRNMLLFSYTFNLFSPSHKLSAGGGNSFLLHLRTGPNNTAVCKFH